MNAPAATADLADPATPPGRPPRLPRLLREHPIPPIALAGLAAGAAARWGAGRPEVGQAIWLATVAVGGLPLAASTLGKLARGVFAADVVALLAFAAALALGEGFAGVIIVLMQSGGEALERRSLGRASSALDRLLARAPRTALKKLDGRLVEVAAAEVRVGDTLVVRPGDLVPVDGVLLSERAEVDESALTGEPMARPRHAGDPIPGGAANAGGAFELRAERPSEESQYARIVRLVRRAQAERPPLQRLADRFAAWFTPLALVVAGFGWWQTGEARTALAVLVVATPCPLILAVPVAVIGGISRAADAGIIVKGGTAIEQVGRARAAAFDKTGTLTFGAPVVSRLEPAPGVPEADLLRSAGAVEQLSTHLLARAVALEAARRLGPLPLPENLREVAGRGVEADLEGRRVVVGSRRFLAERLGQAEVPPPAPADAMAAYVAVDGRPAGLVLFEDRLRPGVPAMLRRLRDLGVRRAVMLSGDHEAHARAIAEQAGLDGYEAGLMPSDKSVRVRAMVSEYGPTLMVGDGINDAPALASATVGIAMGARGTGISAEAADIVLLVDDVEAVAEAVAIGRRMRRVALQSAYAGLGLSLAFMVVAAFGRIPPAAGALIQEAIDVAVILNALRAR